MSFGVFRRFYFENRLALPSVVSTETMAASCVRAAAARFGSCGRRWSVSAATPAHRCQSVMALGRGHLACRGGTSSQEPVTRSFHKAHGAAAAGAAGGGGGRRRRGGAAALWPAAAAFSLFGRGEEDAAEEAEKKQEELILLLKKAKLSVQRGQLQTASSFLHQAVALAHQTHNHQAIIYTYSQMANLAYVQGQLDSAEKLFKAAMSFMLSGGTPQDDNAVIEMSLKLATIYAEQDKVELAEHGFRFCTESLEAKLQKQSEVPAEQQTEEAEALRKETRLLLGLCLDSRSRFRASRRQLSGAVADCQAALAICRQEQGDAHPQTLVLMSDLATILDLQGRHHDALQLIQQAVELSADGEHPERHVLLGNMAGILLHTGRLEEAVRFYHEALGLARRAGDQQAAQQVEEGLKEVERRRKTAAPQEA